ncbi:glycosyl hydrolase 115 family protein [Gilvimarinus agarilyticus]|uniref:glycosyl hydrolase 115 family protein n=1 Tax=Gilvimarinus agarilyticus TaxID=679259 RepID=UPI000AED1657|nr:glycosyl hydrolase 115 family protein [Gilvimarinus agarilyticus]
MLMQPIKKFLQLTALTAAALCGQHAVALGEPSYLTDTPQAGDLRLVDGRKAATLYRDSDADSAIALALDDLKADIKRVTGERATVTTELNKLGKQAVIVGEIGHSEVIDQLIAQQKIDVSDIVDRWEGYLIQVVQNPVAGVEQALIVAGSDRRGTAYGLYDISEQIGVSPWYWWADVPVKKSSDLTIKASTRITDAPKVKYRGIFLNDEAPALTGWVNEKFGNYNHEFYEHVFELLMRLKANYMWPAMWNNAFNDDDPLNMVRAHEHGIVMGTSHHEPMMRADKEWNRYGKGAWDYATNPDELARFWRAGAQRNKPYDSIFTMGMRGQEDTPMSEEQNIGLLEAIVEEQRNILSGVFNDRDVSDVPQLWALYKEVQGYYENGMRVPEDVTLLWADDNWGNIRRLPTPAERERSGGAGVYYHFDYVGGPRSYRWMNVTPIAKIWEQMNLANAFEADRIWIVNVGDLKPQEFPMEYFLRLAWDPADWPKERITEFGKLWAEREFGPEHATEIEQLISGYSRHNGRRKPELMSPDTYSQLHYNEADRISAGLTELLEKAEAIYDDIPRAQRDAFFQLVLHPVNATYIVNELYNVTAKNRLYANQARANANLYAERANELFQADAELTERYHDINGGKWNHFMAQPHIGYTHWNNPPANTMPVTYHYQANAAADMGVAVEGMSEAWPEAGALALPEFSPYGPTSYYVDIYNRGTEPFDFTATPSADWVSVSRTEGEIELSERVYVSINWDQAPTGQQQTSLLIKGTGWGGAKITINALVPTPEQRREVTGFVEAGGVVSIEAPHYTGKQTVAGAEWQTIEQLGHTQGSISVFPVSDTEFSGNIDAPWVEYDVYLFSSGEVTLSGLFAPSLNFVPERGLRYAVAFDDAEPQVVDILADLSQQAWAQAVSDGVRRSSSVHHIEQPGHHKLRIYAIDPGVTLQKLIIDTGGLQPSYLGPPESYHRAP